MTTHQINPYQHTLKKQAKCRGIGLHSGKDVNLTIRPARANSGIHFIRTDEKSKTVIPAFMNRVVDTRLATTIAENNVRVGTTEHLLSALSGFGIDNAIIEIDAAEVPIMDGSAGPFIRLLKTAGQRQQKEYRKKLKITREVSFQDGDRHIRILPYNGLKISAEIDFDHELICRQTCLIEPTPAVFEQEIAAARTFGFVEEVEELRKNGLALGGSLDNAVVMDRTGVLNKDGLRFNNEFVRHKVLDIIGDLALLGCPLLGHIIAYKSGHAQHLGLMQEIVATPEAWEFVELKRDGQLSVLKKVVTTTKAASHRILPFLTPPTTPAAISAGGSCPARA